MNITPIKSNTFRAKFTENKNIREITNMNDPSDKTVKLAHTFRRMQPDTEIDVYYTQQYKQYNKEILEIGLKNLKNNQNLNLKLMKYDKKENLLDNLLTDLIERNENKDDFWHADLSPNNKVYNLLTNKD